MGDNYRTFLHGDAENNTKWRFGAPPKYDVVNKLFEEGRTKVWPPGSMEEKVQTLLKNWEMEIFHKADPNQYRSMDPGKFTFSVNGMKLGTFEDLMKPGGGYNPLAQTSVPDKFKIYPDEETETAESTHKALKTTFPRGFALEIVQVYSGPPVIVVKFRHWGYMEGPFRGHAPTGEKIELFGISIFTLDEDEKVVKVEFFYDPAEMLGPLSKGPLSDEGAVSSCPVTRNTG